MNSNRALRAESAFEKHRRDLREADELASELERLRANDPDWLAYQTEIETRADRRAALRED